MPTTASAQQSSSMLNVSLPSGVSSANLGKRDKQTIAVQAMLDRTRHSPGVIDGLMGGNTRRAIQAYRQANGLGSSGAIDQQLIQSLVENAGQQVFQQYTITSDDVNGPFTNIPSSFEQKAELNRLSYTSPRELLAEKFHMDQDFLTALNPGVDFSNAGATINVIAKGDGQIPGNVARIEIRKSENAVVALSSGGQVLASFPATIGSSEFPSPDGTMTVEAVAPEPKYYFSPEGRDWGPNEKLTIAAGPNNPVGGTWIDLSKEGYGIHGSPDPQLIGKTSSHGCVRLTNWDAEALAEAVESGVTVAFT
ncbi:L,D-transpeptidase family protein [Altericroceibacterium xinjiangense]|uniref:L,D-transpeptidase family protein n=1 Tax=Altericroceibacterium xinjiangense TaxID=762261 RepID=UPI001F49AF8D|nr:L,D-transpeptidase [Altericroceibacterium xinjiangense]